jgi:ABC-2 type transport system ATP-binding protein
MTNPPLIAVHEVSRSFGTNQVLDRVSLTVEAGSILALLGPSGAGKTTLVRMIAGADVAPSGTVQVDGRQMPGLDLLPLIGYMAQSDALYQELSGRQNLEFFGALFLSDRTALDAAITRCSRLVGLEDELDKQVVDYSGGMKRRLSLATSLLHAPKVLLLDEPTVGIDPVLRQAVWNELRALADAGSAILVTTHVMDEAEQCNQVCMLRDGRIIAEDTPAGLMASADASSMQDAFLYYAQKGA